jgi:hypothetical protein
MSEDAKERWFTVEVEYLTPTFQTVTVLAASPEEACAKALEKADENWDDSYNGDVTMSYVSALWNGKDESGKEHQLRVPQERTRLAAVAQEWWEFNPQEGKDGK